MVTDTWRKLALGMMYATVLLEQAHHFAHSMHFEQLLAGRSEWRMPVLPSQPHGPEMPAPLARPMTDLMMAGTSSARSVGAGLSVFVVDRG